MTTTDRLAQEIIEQWPGKDCGNVTVLKSQIMAAINEAVALERRVVELLVTAEHVSPEQVEMARKLAASLK